MGWARCQTREFEEERGCYRCNAQDHRLANCKMKEGEKACYRCGKLDHLAKRCPMRGQRLQQQQRKLESVQQLQPPQAQAPQWHGDDEQQQQQVGQPRGTGARTSETTAPEGWPALPENRRMLTSKRGGVARQTGREKDLVEEEIHEMRGSLEVEPKPAERRPRMVDRGTQTEETTLGAQTNPALTKTWRDVAAATGTRAGSTRTQEHPEHYRTAESERRATLDEPPQMKRGGGNNENNNRNNGNRRSRRKSKFAILASHPEIEYRDMVTLARELAEDKQTCGVTGIRRATRGETIIELQSQEKTQEWVEKIQARLGPEARVVTLSDTTTVKIRHLDAMVTEQEIKEPLQKEPGHARTLNPWIQ